MYFCCGRRRLAVLAMAFVALGAPAQDGGDGQSAVRDRGRDRALEKQRWFLSGRSPVSGSAADMLRRAREAQPAFQAGREAQENPPFVRQWEALGPRPLDSDPTLFQSYGYVSGRVTAIAVDQKDQTGNTVYIGTANGGVWKSQNAAAADPNAVSWAPLTDSQPSLSIGTLAIQPGASASVILAGTGEANHFTEAYYGMGVLRSADSGASWTLVSAANGGTRPFRGLSFSRIAFHTTSTDVVVAGVSSGNGERNGADVQGASGSGIYYSLNAGASWSYATVQDAGVTIEASAVTDVVFNPAHNKFYAAVRAHGLYESANGQSWARMAQQPGPALSAANCPAATNAVTCPLLRAKLAVRQGSGEVFVGWIDGANALSLYKLSSNGGSWQAMGTTGIINCGDAGNVGCGAQQGNYNLTLGAVPNGNATDLYFGAVNLFKCTVTAIDLLCGNADSWKNLTHAYGCSPLGAPAHVHPGQHAVDYAAGTPARVFFANDGGMYRALQGHELTSGSCSTLNAFDNLNANLGPLAEFVHLAQPSAAAGTLLGGAMTNGSPLFVATDAGASGLLWRAANLGDGGYAAIDPTNANVLYTSFPAGESAAIQRCAIGASCRQNTWTNVVEPATLGNDASAFFMPYVLDPRNPATLLAATCRVWRGPAGGGSFAVLSPIFSGGGATTCSGGTTTGETKVRSLAAGGPAANSGNAKVIYAGLVGRAGGAAGRIFVTTDSDSGAWSDRTGGINPSEYDVSAIVISPHDATGHTAYVGIMGFGVPHIFKTTNAGVTWSDRSGNLPDVPVNALAVDPANSSVIYAGTDAGVYVTGDDGATWSKFGAGLPNVPLMKLLTFTAGGARKLRAATFGRGVWQVEMPSSGLIASAPAVIFDATVIGRTSPPRVLTLTNDSVAPLTLTSVTAPSAFTLTHDCPAVMAVGVSCTVQLDFRPVIGGNHAGQLQVQYNSGSTQVALSGAGVDFSLALSRPRRPARGGGGNAIVLDSGRKAEIEVALQMTAPADNEFNFTCAAPARVPCWVAPQTVRTSAQGGTALVVLEVGPAAERAHRLRRRNVMESTTYAVRLRACSGAACRVIEVPLQIR